MVSNEDAMDEFRNRWFEAGRPSLSTHQLREKLTATNFDLHKALVAAGLAEPAAEPVCVENKVARASACRLEGLLSARSRLGLPFASASLGQPAG